MRANMTAIVMLGVLYAVVVWSCGGSEATDAGLADSGGTGGDTGGGGDAGVGNDAGVDDAGYNPVIDPANFVGKVNNKYCPLVPGTVFAYKDQDNKKIEITVTSDTKTILGVTCVVVHDKVTDSGGALVEDTYDWYAQDKDGNVWYFGEDTKTYTGGQVTSTKGSWEGGVGGAKPGMIMEATPKVGDSYRQEYLAGVAEDRADIVSIDETANPAAGTYQHCVMTKDYSALEPDKAEHKYYCPDVGVALILEVQGGTGREELVSVTKP